MQLNSSDTEYPGMQVVLTSPTGTQSSLWLPPGQPQGRYTSEALGMEHFFIEGRGGIWTACCSGTASFANRSGSEKTAAPLEDLQILIYRDNDETFFVYPEFWSGERGKFRNFQVPDRTMISIGRIRGNDIQYQCPYVSGNQATLEYADGKWYVWDHESLNGTFLNGKRIQETALELGDCLYISGLRIIIGTNFLSINCYERDVSLNQNKFCELCPSEPAANSQDAISGQQVFNRQPRRRLSLSTEPIVIEGPPMTMNGNKMPLMLRMGGSMAMSVSSLLAGRFTTLISSVLFPVMSSKYTDKERKEYEQRRVELYSRYLEEKRRSISEEKEREEYALNQNYPGLQRILQFPADGKRLWERRPNDDDFLTLRVGVGSSPLMAEIQYPNESFSMDEDPLEKSMLQLAKSNVQLENVPIQISLQEDFVCGITGIRWLRMDLIRNLILQLTILHSYDEVKLIFLSDAESLKELNFVRYLPHVWTDDRSMRFIALNAMDASQISEYLKKERDDGNQSKSLKDVLKKHPYYVIFALDKRVFDSAEVIKDILNDETSMGSSIIAAYGDLPKECTKIIQMNASGTHSMLSLKQLDSATQEFSLDTYDKILADTASRQLSATQLKTISESFSLPKTYTFLEMYGVGKVEHLNILQRWQDNNPTTSLAVPVGIGTDGQLFQLDLHQKFQGPHGLVAGMTGSGKSEFIITYILSLAVNFHPDEVAFILIDYKGGGLAGAFDNPDRGVKLPHVIGTITNLDGAAIQRSLLSIQSELMRRQRIFNRAKSISNEGTMDIYSYQRLYRSGKVQEPLPHLFIISDEFAELKQQEPEFMENLMSIARIGRSLGIHLILATQKPAGVVNDQIRSNTKFRVCLKVQDKSDSMDMLNRPEAVELKDTGRFYLQVGYNEYFALGQSAWCGMEYEPQEEVIVQLDSSVEVLDQMGRTVCAAKPAIEKVGTGKTQLVAIVEYLSTLAKEAGMEEKSLWKPALPAYIPYASLPKEVYPHSASKLQAMVGLTDDPEMQKQEPLWVELGDSNLLILGESQSGKTTLLQTLLYDIVINYSPDEVNYYLFDFSKHALQAFQQAPHCGAWICEDDDAQIDRLIRFLVEIADKRKQLFYNAGVTSYESYVQHQQLPQLVVIVDNYYFFNTLKQASNYCSMICELMKICVPYGIKFVLTATHANEVNNKTKLECGGRIALHLKDKYVYGDVLNQKCAYVPPDQPGRGLVCVDGRVLEFQIAAVGDFTDATRDREAIKCAIEAVRKRYPESHAWDMLPVVNENETYEAFCSRFSSGRIPLGYALQNMRQVALPLRQFSMLSVYFGNPQGISAVWGNFLYAARHNQMKVIFIKRNEGSCYETLLPEAPFQVVDCYAAQLHQLLVELASELQIRRVLLENYCKDNQLNVRREDIYVETFCYMAEKSVPILIMIENFSEFCASIDPVDSEAFSMLFNYARKLNIYIISGHYPNDPPISSSAEVVEVFNPDRLFMLFGGQFHRQPLDKLPREYAQLENPSAYNKCLMRYRDQYYPVLMPCGDISAATACKDDESIF